MIDVSLSTLRNLASGLVAASVAFGATTPAPAQPAGTPHITYLWHLHQPIYWPGQKTDGPPDRYEYAWETIRGLQSGRGFPIDAVGDYFDVDDREAVYQGRPWFSIDNADNNFDTGRDAGAQVTYSGALMENVDSLAGRWASYGSGWRQPFIDGRRARTHSNSKPKLDLLNFSYHHGLLPLLTPRTVDMELALHRRKTQLEFGTDQPLSRGIFPTEMCYSPWLIPHFKAAGIEWTIVSGNHLSRAMPDFPLQFGSGGENTQPPNRADVRNPAGVNWFRKTIDRGCSPVNAAPFSYTPHRNYWINPETGTTQTIIVIPAAQEFGWDDGYKVIGPGEFSFVRQFNNPARPMLMLLAHDGDNAFGGGFSYYFEGVPQMVNQAPGAGWWSSTIEEYLARHPVPENALVHVENGGWVNPDGDFGSPTFINWNFPLLNAQGQHDPKNGWHEKPREYALHLAIENRIRTAEAKVGGVATTRLDNIINPGLSGTTAVERAWHYYLGSLDSGYLYYGDYGDVEIRGTVGMNKAATLVDPILATGFTDTVGPSVWLPQRWPYNPGGVNFGVETRYTQRVLGPDFTVWTFAYDAGSTVTATLKWRVDNDGFIGINDTHNATYAGGPGVGPWNSTTMTRRAFPAGNIYNKPSLNYSVLPTHIADHFHADITGQAGKLIDYYVEAVDAAGNITRSPIQHVYVGTQTGESGGTPGGDRVTVSPNPPVAGQPVTISYNAAAGLPGATTVNLYYGINNWNPVVETARAMQFDAATQRWWTTPTLSVTANRLNMVFNNGAGQWDNNLGQDYNFNVVGGQEPPPPAWTIDGNIEPVDYRRAQTTGGLTLYAAFQGTKLYVATQAPPNSANDHFLYIARNPGALRPANWAKSGQIAAWDAFLAAESTNSFIGWFNANATQSPAVPGTLAARNGLMEGEVDLAALYGGDIPSTIYIAAAAFGTADNGALVFSTQVPVTINSDGNIDAPEYLGFPLTLAPEMGVESAGGVPIPNGDDTPSLSDGTDFSTAVIGETTVTRTFRIRNSGNAPLVLASPVSVALEGAHATDFLVVRAPATTITAGGSTTFDLRFNPAALGVRTATVRIGVANGAPYTFAIRGTAVQPVPRIEVRGTDGSLIANGTTTTTLVNGTDFGTYVANGNTYGGVFSVANPGTGLLTLNNSPTVVRIVPGPGTEPTEFYVGADAATTVAAGGTSNFSIVFFPQTVGAKSATVRILPTNVAGVSEYTFTIRATVTSPVANIDIRFGTTVIPNGSTSVSTVLGTDFGSWQVGTSLPDRTYTIRNTGTANLTISASRVQPGPNTGPLEFTIPTNPPTTIAPGSFGNLPIRFSPSTPGQKTAVVTVEPGNVPGVSSYTFVVGGTATAPPVPPGIVVRGNGQIIVNGSSATTTANGTDFGGVFINEFKEQSFAITNTSPDLPLTISSAVLQAGDTAVFTMVQSPVGTVPPGGTTQMRVRYSPDVPGGGEITAVITSNAQAPDNTYRFRMTATSLRQGDFTPQLTNPFPSAAGWSPIGQLPPLFTSAFGSRQHDAVNTALAVTVAPNPRGRVIGWVEDPDNDLRYADIGPSNFVRAKFSMFYSGPGDSASATLFNRVPNFRLALRMRGMVQTVLEVNHNPEIAGSPAQAFVTRELGPSKNPAAPSVYRVDLDPVDVPYFTNSTTEGVQRAFEAVMTEPKDYSFVEGTLALTDSSIGTYPALSDAVTPVKTWASGGTAGAADFDNPTVVTGGLSLTVADLLRYLGGPSPADYYNPAVLNAGFDTAPATITRSTAGVTANTAGLATTRVAAMTANLLGGVFGDTPATRLRVEPGRLYRVSARVSHAGPSDTTPFTRLGVRTAGFGWNQTLELLGARGLPAATGTRPGLAQMLPGTGNQVPGTTGDGTVYNLIFGTPLHPQIRADVAGTIAAKFPNLSAQPGPGDPATGAGSPPDGSLRNVNLAFTVIDSLSPASATATDPAEVANNLRLNRVEIRIYPDVVD